MRFPRKSLIALLVAAASSGSVQAQLPFSARGSDSDFIRSAYSSSTPYRTVSNSGQCSDDACTTDVCGDLLADGTGCGSEGCVDDEPFSLSGLFNCSECSPWKIGGWTQVGYYDNNVPLSQARNDLLSFNDVADLVQLNQQWLYVERTASQNGDWGLGGRIDVMYGVDAQKTQAFGNPNAGIRNQGDFDASWDNGIYGFAMPQMYAEVANEDLSIKAGHFFTPIGYEVVPSTGNFFYSHSYTMFNSEPFTHTGVLATYTGVENLTLYGGWALGWDTGFDQLNSGNIWLGGFSANVTDDVTFAYLNTLGNFGWRDGGSDDSYSHSMVLTVDATEKIQYVAQSDLIRTDNPGVSQFDTVGLNQYLFYSLSDDIRLGSRLEWWKADGVSFNGVTAGVNVKLMENFVVRPEYRHDWSPGIGLLEDTFGVDAIWSY